MIVNTNGTTSTMAIPTKNAPQFCGKIDRKAGKPPTPTDGASTPINW